MPPVARVKPRILSASGIGVTLSGGEARVEPGGEGYIWAQLDKTFVQDRAYATKIYTRAGNVYALTIYVYNTMHPLVNIQFFPIFI